MSLLHWAHDRALAIMVVVGLLAVAGRLVVTGMPLAIFPSVTFPVIKVIADVGHEPAARMMPSVTRPLEQALLPLPGMRLVRSTTSRGSTELSANFEWGTDMQVALQRVQDAIARADIVVISIGYNNGAPWGPDDPCHVKEVATDADLVPAILAMTPQCITDTIEKYRGVLDAVYGRVAVLAAGRPQVRVTFGVFDNLRGNPGGDGTLPDVPAEEMQPALELFVSIFDRWNAMDCEVATAHGFVCADLRHAFNGPDGNTSVGTLTATDWVHPNEAGQAVMAKLLQCVDASALTGGS